ncbi:MAG: hypothetical protein ACRD6N_08290 [Pyrinomonadaceae bacterium]
MLLLLGIFITLLGPSVDATDPSNLFVAQQANSISGHVADDRHTPIPDLHVELELFLKIQPDAKDTVLIKKLIQRFRQQSGGNVNP